jgi:hypothetical protein
MTRANDPTNKRERLLHMLRSRTQADAPWTDVELADELCCTPRTVQRYREWLRARGHLPGRLDIVGSHDTYSVTATVSSRHGC